MQCDNRRSSRLTRGTRERVRGFASFYLLGFLAAVAFAPHRHLDSLADLLSEGRSDSGIFVESSPLDTGGGARIQPARLVDDDPCLACFHHDYAATASTPFVVDRTLTPRLEGPASSQQSIPEPTADSPASRSPPRAL